MAKRRKAQDVSRAIPRPDAQAAVSKGADGSAIRDEWSPEFVATLGSWKETIELPRSSSILKMKNPFAEFSIEDE